jgi:uncharacterized membrane protein YfcA
MVFLFFIAAMLYASVGLGGGSTYIALLAAWGVPHTSIPQIVLLCNMVVVSGGCLHFFRSGHGNIKTLLPFLVASVPMAYLGGSIPISKTVFMMLLGGTLFVAGLRLLLCRQVSVRLARAPRHIWVWGLSAGGVLGLVSGLVGIGGGIFLAPVLYFLRWDDAKGVAAATSFFILLNSLSGLVGQVAKGGFTVAPAVMVPLIVAVVVGGQIGSWCAVHRLSPLRLQQLTGVFILSVAIQTLWKVVV